MPRKLLLLIVFVLAMIVAPSARSQENATITGTVTDPSGAAVPNVAITLTNQATGQVRQTVSNNDGIYSFRKRRRRTLSRSAASAAGFQKFTRTDIVVNTAQTLKEDVGLAVGSEGQTVTVQANALQVQSETSEISTLISGAQVTQLATNGRNVTALAALGMGVSNNLPAFSGVLALTSANGISFNGTRTTHNIYLLDGGELNDRGCGGCFSSLPSIDALAEFQTLDSNYSAGLRHRLRRHHSHGPQVGHSRLSWRAVVLQPKRRLRREQLFHETGWSGRGRSSASTSPAFNIGGPLFIPHVYNTDRRRTFFFVNEEWRRLIQGSSPSIANTIMASNFPIAGQPSGIHAFHWRSGSDRSRHHRSGQAGALRH